MPPPLSAYGPSFNFNLLIWSLIKIPLTRANHNGAVCNNIKVEVKSVLLISQFASVLLITKQGSLAECSDLNIVEFRIFRTFSELKLWFIFIYEHRANQNSVRFSVSIIFHKFRSSKCTQSVCLHHRLSDLTSTLNIKQNCT